MSPNLPPSFLRNLLRLRLAEYLGQSNVSVPPVSVMQDDYPPFTRFVQHKLVIEVPDCSIDVNF